MYRDTFPNHQIYVLQFHKNRIPAINVLEFTTFCLKTNSISKETIEFASSISRLRSDSREVVHPSSVRSRVSGGELNTFNTLEENFDSSVSVSASCSTLRIVRSLQRNPPWLPSIQLKSLPAVCCFVQYI